MSENIFVDRCRLLATLAVADDDVAPEELAFLERVMDRFQITGQDRALALTVFGEDELASAVESLSAMERLAFLVELAALAWADGRLDKEEIRRIEQIAGGMGFDKDDVARALEEAKPDA